MKRCPKCGQAYADPDLNFCLNDGELLMQMQDPSLTGSSQRPFADDPPPTVMMNDARATNPTGWTGGSSPAPYQNTSPAYQAPQFEMGNRPRSLDQTLPTVSLILGIASLIFVCCYGGLWLGIPAAVVGFMGMRNADSDPTRYGGRGLAIAGMILGIVTLVMSILILMLGIAGNLL